MACSQGDIETVKEFVENDSYYVTAYSKNGGESCLHVAGILGQSLVTQYILQNNGNPNQRVSKNIQSGLRMTPLSWNVYGNHIDNVQLLLKAGADVNLDFDYVIDGTLQKVTVLDLLLYVNSKIDFDNEAQKESKEDKNSDEDEEWSYERRVRSMHDLLLQHGAKRYIDIESSHSNNSNQKVEL